jgi:hypothetical protein
MQISAGRIREANFLKIVSVTKTHILQKGCLIVEYFFYSVKQLLIKHREITLIVLSVCFLEIINN